MAMTSEERSKLPLCGARKKNGELCRAIAGQKTDHLGSGNCAYHGGATPNGKKHALKLETQARMVAMSVPLEAADAQPHKVLLTELSYSAGHCQWLREEIGALDPETIGDERSKTLLSRLDSERDRLTRIAQGAASAGVDEAMIQIHQAQAMTMVRAITQAAEDAGIPRDYVKALGPALRRQLALLAGDDAAAAEQEAVVARVRDQIQATEARRAEKAAQRFSGLTFPPEEYIVEGREASP